MQFRIVTLGWIMVYVALAITSLRYPTAEVATAIQLLCVLSVAVCAVIAFDRRSTAYFAFVVFAIATGTNLEIGSQWLIAIMLQLGVTTGSTEYAYLEAMLHYHSVFALGLIGFLFGGLVSRFRRNEAAQTRP